MRIKKKLSCIVLLCLLLSVAVPALANEDTARVFDYAELLTEEQEQSLEQLCLENEDAVETELYILTTKDTGGKDTMAYADDFGDEHAFGYDQPYGSYMVLCIDMQNRIVWLSTSGKAEDYFTEYRIDALLDHVTEYLALEDYYRSCTAYITSGVEYLSEEPVVNSSTTDPDRYQDTIYQYDEEPYSIWDGWYIRLAISAAVGAVVVGAMSYHAGSRMTVDARTYSKRGLQIYNRTDAFIRRATSSRKIESNSSSGRSGGGGGGGGHHTSSSGRSHGGGGRSF